MGAGERTSDQAVLYRAADCNQLHRLRLGKISSSLRVTLMEYSVLDQDQTLQGRHCLIPRRMWDENTPERAALMTFALRSPETRQNTARTPGSSSANACTCVCPPTSCAQPPSGTPGTACTACRQLAPQTIQVSVQR